MEPMIYLNFNGNCLEAMTSYSELLGGEITGVFLNSDAPNPEARMPGGDNLVMNMTMLLGKSVMMASDAAEGFYNKPSGFSVSLAPDSLEEFDRIYAALTIDAQSIRMPAAKTFWAAKFAVFIDRFGTPWMLNFEG